MTYIIVGQKKQDQEYSLEILLTKTFGKSLTISPDIHTLELMEKNSIGIEDIKIFQKEMRFRPFEESVQVGVIKESEKLTKEAQNALLKTLEDSSTFSIYILCVNNEKNLLPTIISRGQTIYSRGQEDEEQDEEEKTNVLEKDIVEIFEDIEKYSKNKTDTLEFLERVEDIYRRRLELDIKNGNIDSSQQSRECLEIIQNSREKISANCNKRLTLEAMIIQLNA